MIPTYKKILLTTDLTPNADYAFKHAVRLARCNDAKIALLHVLPEVDAAVRSYVSTIMGQGSLEKFEHQHEDKAREGMRRELEEFARKELANHPEDLERIEEIEVVHGHPAVMILQTADRLQVDAIVMGTHGKGPLDYAFLGSVAEKVLRKSRRPVFVIPIP